MTGRSLVAWIDQAPIGYLHERDGVWAFEYAPTWVSARNSFALSPHLPLSGTVIQDGGSRRPVQWYFDNLLPEEGQRKLLAADVGGDVADAFGLLMHYGAESAGSLTLLPPEQAPAKTHDARSLPNEELSARIRALPHVPLTHGSAKRMSLAGAQHKLAVTVRDGALLEPVGNTPSTHILKPDHTDPDYSHSVANEWFVMCLAQQAGLDVPSVERRHVPEPVYLIERFDRLQTPDGFWHRRHAIDACQLLGLDRQFKYSQGSVEMLSRIAALCRAPAPTRARLFQWLVFNVLVGNDDAHLKNLSFLVDSQGIELAPFYDLISTACYEAPLFDKHGWPDRTTLAWPILNARRFAEVNRTVLIEAGKALGIGSGTASRLLDVLQRDIGRSADQLLQDLPAQDALASKAAPDAARFMAGEERCLRGIRHVVLAEMMRKLAP